MIMVDKVVDDEFLCFCPWHHDDNPSLNINLRKDAAICFAGCYSGDAVGAVAKAEGVTKTKAHQLILDNLAFDFSGVMKSLGAEENHTSFTDFRDENLGWKIAANLGYLLKRGFSQSSIVLWGIEYSEIIRHIRIPIFNQEEELIGCIYRTIDDLKPKYLYNKGLSKKSILFGINNVRIIGRKLNLVEGALDCIWMHQCGFPNTLAILGSNLSKEQCEIVKSLEIDIVHLCMDNDFAGMLATKNMKKQLKAIELSCKSLVYPDESKDVQELDFAKLVSAVRRL